MTPSAAKWKPSCQPSATGKGGISGIAPGLRPFQATCHRPRHRLRPTHPRRLCADRCHRARSPGSRIAALHSPRFSRPRLRRAVPPPGGGRQFVWIFPGALACAMSGWRGQGFQMEPPPCPATAARCSCRVRAAWCNEIRNIHRVASRPESTAAAGFAGFHASGTGPRRKAAFHSRRRLRRRLSTPVQAGAGRRYFPFIPQLFGTR